MNEIDRHLAALARQQHEVFSRDQAIAAGLDRHGLHRRVRSSLYVVLGTNSLCFAGTDLSFRGRLTAGLFDLGPDALVSGRSAAALLELDGFGEGLSEYLVPRDQRHRAVNGLLTSSPSINRLDRTEVDGIRCTSGTRTVVQLILTGAAEREVGNALDGGSRRRLTAPSVVRRRLDELRTWATHRAGRLRLRAHLRDRRSRWPSWIPEPRRAASSGATPQRVTAGGAHDLLLQHRGRGGGRQLRDRNGQTQPGDRRVTAP